MTTSRILTATGTGLIALLAVSAAHADPPDSIKLTGVLRDFRASHPDFDVAGTGHCAGNVDLLLGGNGRPAFTDNGYEVLTQWRNAGGRPNTEKMVRQNALR